MANHLPGPLPDEDIFAVPEEWRPHLHPRRGGAPGRSLRPRPAAVTAARERQEQLREQLEQALAHPSTAPKLAGPARAHLAGEPSPTGAAVVAAFAARVERRAVPSFADAWAVEHGLPFAARAAVALYRVWVSGEEWGNGHERCHVRVLRQWDQVPVLRRSAGEIARRVRALLAAAGEREHEEAADALRAVAARGSLAQRIAAAYLVPERQDWMDAVLAEEPDYRHGWDTGLLVCALGSARQAARLRELDTDAWRDIRHHAFTVAEGVGPAIAPVMAALFDDLPAHRRGTRTGTAPLTVLAALPTDEAFRLLLDRLDQPHVHPAVAEAMRRYPVRALRLLADAASGTTHRARLAARLLSEHTAAHPGLADAADLTPRARKCVEAAANDTTWAPDAPADALPRLLVEPPWTRERKEEEPVVVPGLAAPQERAVVWAPGEREQWLSALPPRWYDDDEDWPRMARLQESGGLSPYLATKLVCEGPEELVRPLLPALGTGGWWYAGAPLRVAARFELDALPMFRKLARLDPVNHGGLLLPFFDAETAALMADWLERLKRARETAVAWLLRHPAPAARALVPAALGSAARQRRAAEAALRLLAERGHAAEVRAAARFHGERAEAGVEALLGGDPLDRLPERIPTAAGGVDYGVLPQVLLRDRRAALPETALRHLVTMLAMSRPDEVYPGVRVVKELCDPASLDAFAWALFEQVGKGAAWILPALGAVGGDETARRLTPLIRSWPGEGAHAKAVAGLDTLLAIGSDVALVQLNGIAQKVRYKGVKARAQERIEALAADLGLTPDQLADRLVPDFGLDRDGSLVLDYGPRSFTAGFDEQLKPYVTDGGGKRLKNLPRPGAKDDPELAPAAYARFAALKKDVRTVAADQIRRLEQAMVRGRHWPLAEFRTHIAEHPLLWHIARRVVWLAGPRGVAAGEDAGAAAGPAFRVAEDRTLADADDETLTLPEDAHIRVAHPVHLDGSLETWAELFADYEILQPFPQLGRPVHTLTEEERSGPELARFHGLTVPVGRVLGLEQRGWERGPALDGGIQGWLSKAVAPGRWAVLELNPGIAVGAPEYTPEQTVEQVRIHDHPGGDRHPGGSPRFGELDRVAASELLADLNGLAARAG
ncbi:hypothetical protein GCM10027168_17160 [Streptomyces capparidis]